MKYKALIQISNDVSDTFLSKGDVFEVVKLHIQGTGIVWAELKYIPPKVKKIVDDRERPETITIDVLDNFCEKVE